MVIFLFLRNVWATIIPSITIPVALVGTLGAMYVCGFSLDNLSLMGLTIAVGFVVDDAIVMLENIFRHIEEGMKPLDAALKGAGEIGFTIVSISVSLIAGVHPAAADGRHRRPAVPRIRDLRVDHHRHLGAGVADADADDVLALPVAARAQPRPHLQRRRAHVRRDAAASTSARSISRCASASSR